MFRQPSQSTTLSRRVLVVASGRRNKEKSRLTILLWISGVRQWSESPGVLAQDGKFGAGWQRLPNPEQAKIERQLECIAAFCKTREVSVRSGCGVVSAEQWIEALTLVKLFINERYRYREALTGLVARDARLPICAEARVEEDVGCTDNTRVRRTARRLTLWYPGNLSRNQAHLRAVCSLVGTTTSWMVSAERAIVGHR